MVRVPARGGACQQLTGVGLSWPSVGRLVGTVFATIEGNHVSDGEARVSTKGKSPRFWTTLPGVLTAVAGLMTAVTGLLVALDQVGVIGTDRTTEGSPNAPTAGVKTSSPSPSASRGAGGDGEGDALVGTWRGVATSADGTDPFDVQLEIAAPCRYRQPCGTISVSSTPCTGRVTLWAVRSRTYEFYVDRFTADSSSDCSPGAGDFFELVGNGTLKYTTGYSDAVGVLHKRG